MSRNMNIENVKVDPKSQYLVQKILTENPAIKEIFEESKNVNEVYASLRKWVLDELEENSTALQYYSENVSGRDIFTKLNYKDFAAIRILDFIDHEGMEYEDPHLRGKVFYNNPIRLFWLAVKFGKGGAKPDFFEDLLNLFRQFNGKLSRVVPDKEKVTEWMERHPTGLDQEIIEIRKENKERIINTLIRKIDEGEYTSSVFKFEPNDSDEKKKKKMYEWW